MEVQASDIQFAVKTDRIVLSSHLTEKHETVVAGDYCFASVNSSTDQTMMNNMLKQAAFMGDKMKYKTITLPTVMNKDSKLGGLTFVEAEHDIPFEFKRIYCIYKVSKDEVRGFHAHKKNWQLLFCPYGCIDIIINDGKTQNIVTLDSPSKGLIMSPGLWREMEWKQDDSVLCVGASEYYDPDEYIRDYEEYLKFVNKGMDTSES